ncbi:MAG: hypothetical protein MMC23_005681 [Stictis urceolatum]|nr:hypothetical protein [Stictis urceolata]
MPKSNLDLICECDNFPYPDSPAYSPLISSYYKFQLLTTWDAECTIHVKVGYLLPSTVQRMPWTPSFTISHLTRTVSIPYSPASDESSILHTQLTLARSQRTFAVLTGWRNELYPVHGLNRPVAMERAGSALFGIHTTGVHMIGYTFSSPTKTLDSLQIWVPRRAQTKQTYGGMLDNTVAGGIATGEDQFESLVREAGEEASLPEEFVRKEARAAGAVSYFHVRDWRAGGEEGLLQPETQFVYDLEMPADMVPRPSDDEVERFSLMGVEELEGALRSGEFKPNCAVCLVDFFVRRGVLSAREEGDYLEICQRMHRRIAFE